ncbi:MAG: GAF domain-containing protein [Anaerolineae bacterium]|jgi:GAF domain-containing protein/CheY-like chemotaxis protein/nitrogen-specific signal transduction histidine kinase
MFHGLQRSYRRLALVLGAWGAYGLIFIPAYRLAGPIASALAVLPILATSWRFGETGGVVGGLLAFLSSLLLLKLAGGDAAQMVSPGGVIGSSVLVLTGAIVGRLHDLSKRVRRELSEREHIEEMLHRQNARLQTLNAISQALASTLRLEEMLDEALAGTVDMLNVTGGIIALRDEGTGRLNLVAHKGLAGIVVEHLEGVAAEGTLCELAYGPGGPPGTELLGAGTLPEDDVLYEMGLQSYVAVRIARGEQVFGTLFALDTSPYPVDEPTGSLLTAIGQQLGVAIGNAQLYKRTAEDHREAHTLLKTAGALSTTLRFEVLLERVLNQLRLIVPYDTSAVVLLQDDFCQVAASRGWNSPARWQRTPLQDRPLVERVVRERQPLLLSDMQGVPTEELGQHAGPLESWLGIPLVARDSVVGVLTAGSRGAGVYDEESKQLAFAFAHQAALAIENSRLYERMRSQLQEVRVLQEVTAAISSTLDVEQVLPYVAHSLCEILKGTSTEIFSVDGGGGDATAVTSYAAEDAVAAERDLEPGRTEVLDALPGTTGALERREPLQIQKDNPDTDPGARAVLEARGAQSMLLLPIVARDLVLGFARVWDSATSRRFTRRDIVTGETLAHQTAFAMENARLFEQTRASLIETRALYRISRSLIAKESLSDVLQGMVDEVVKAVSADRATVTTFDLEASRVTNSVKGGPGSDRVAGVSFEELWNGLSGWVLRELQPALSPKGQPDPRESPRVQRRRRETGAGSILVVPVICRGRPLGTMTVINRVDQRDFTEEDLDLMMAFANQAAAALENARLIEETQRRATQLAAAADVARAATAIMDQEQLLEVVVGLIQQQFGFRLAAVFLVDREGDQLYPAAATDDFAEIIPDGYRQPVGKGAVGTAAETGETVLIKNAGASSVAYRVGNWLSPSSVSVPIQIGGIVLGVLEVEAEAIGAFDENDRLALEIIADQIAISYQNAELLTETRSRVNDLQLLHDVSLAAASTSHLQETLQAAAEALAAEWKSTQVALQLVDRENDSLRMAAGVGHPLDEVGSLDLPLGRGITGWVAQTGEAVLAPDVREDPRYYQVNPNTGSELCVPLRSGSEVVGTLNVESPSVNAFTPDDQRLLTTLAGNLASLIDRARLFEEIEAARTELQYRAEALEEANARLTELDRLKSRFLANMSHELRTPLNSVIGFSEVLLDGLLGDMPPEQKECVDNIYASGEHLMALINDILDLSKIEAGRMELVLKPFDVAEMVRNVQKTVTPMITEKSQILTVDVEDDLPELTADRVRVRQVLLNLLSNAHKFTPLEGEITLTCRLADPTTILFSVSDTGIGIRQDDQQVIFEEFRQADSSEAGDTKGTGLGLTISKRLVELHDGSIWVESERGEGATFSFLLPVSGPSVEEPEADDEGVIPPAGRRVLIVEDDRQFSNLLALYLRREGYIPIQHYRGSGAVEQARDLNPTLITLDVMLPSQDGWQILERLKSDPQTRDIPVLVISALRDGRLALSLGASDYLVKPVDRDALHTVLSRLSIEEPPPRPSTILLIDDDPDLAPLLRAMLQGRCELIPAYDGEEGLAKARTQRPDGILLDLMMPGMSGFEVLDSLKADDETVNIPVIVLTVKNVTAGEREQLNDQIESLMEKRALTPQALTEQIRRFETPRGSGSVY